MCQVCIKGVWLIKACMRHTVGNAPSEVQKAVVAAQRPNPWQAVNRQQQSHRHAHKRVWTQGPPEMATVFGTRTHLRAFAAASTLSSVLNTRMLWRRQGEGYTYTEGDVRGGCGFSVQNAHIWSNSSCVSVLCVRTAALSTVRQPPAMDRRSSSTCKPPRDLSVSLYSSCSRARAKTHRFGCG